MPFTSFITARFKSTAKPRPLEWEKFICGCACGVVLIILGLWGYDLFHHGAAVKPVPGVSMPPSLLNRASAFNFLLPPDRFTMDKNHLFAWSFPAETIAKLVDRRNGVTPPAPAATPPAPAPGLAVTAAPAAAAAAAAVVEPPPPPKPKAVCILEYRGCMTLASGARAALINNQTGGVSAFFRVGEKISGIEIKSFDDAVLQLLSPTGATVQIPFGTQAEVMIE